MSYSINPSRNFRAWISSAGRRLCNAAPFAAAALALLVLAAPAQAQTDYDTDDDNLIEVSTLEQLNAIRYDLDGDGDPDSTTDDTDYFAAFTGTGTNLSCNSTCTGYELTADLDFDVAGSYASGTVSSAWTSGDGFPPIGEFTPGATPTRSPFTGTFDGNRHTISNLQMDPTGTIAAGLFSLLGEGGVVRNVGLVAVEVTGVNNAGAVVGRSEGTVFATYATGTVTGQGGIGGLVGHQNGEGLTTEPRVAASYSAVTVNSTSGAGNNTGGLVGLNNVGDIIASYATGNVTGSTNAVGGLVGSHRASGSAVIASYSTGAVTPPTGGGLIGDIRPGTTVTNSYWATTTSGISDDSDTNSPEGETTSNLQTPTAYGTGIYANWNVNVDGTSGDDDPWDFGTTSQYPVLKVNFDGALTVFGPQRGPGAPTVTRRLTQDDMDRDIIEVTITRGPAGGDPASYQYRFSTDGDPLLDSWTAVSGTTFTILVDATANSYTIEVRASNALVAEGPPASLPLTSADLSGRGNDSDGDNLIEVETLAQLNAIRYDLNGDGHADDSAYTAAYASAFSNIPCAGADAAASTCTGYELFAASFSATPDRDTPEGTPELDFRAPAHASYPAASRRAWTSGSGWLPIGAAAPSASPSIATAGVFTGDFDGNGYAISNLFINRSSTDNVGLFASIGASSEVTQLALKEVNVTGQDNVGGLAGTNAGDIQNSGDFGVIRWVYVTGSVSGDNNVGGVVGENRANADIAIVWTSADVEADADTAGGLVGNNLGKIAASYATGTVQADNHAGGLIGSNGTNGTVVISYATGAVSKGLNTGTNFGGLIGDNSNTANNAFIDSYWDTESSGLSVGVGSDDTDNNGRINGSETRTAGVRGYTTAALSTPTDYTGIYATWKNQDLFGFGAVRPYTFRPSASASPHYPKLAARFADVTDGSGGTDDNHFGPQHLGPVSGLSAALSANGRRITISWNHDMDERYYWDYDQVDEHDNPAPGQKASITCTGNGAVPCYQYARVLSGIGGEPLWNNVQSGSIDLSTQRVSVVIPYDQNPNSLDYTVEVRPVALFGVTGTTATLEFTEPAAPTGVDATVEPNSAITVEWTAPTDTGTFPISGYSVQYRHGTSGNWSDAGHTGTDATATISGRTNPTGHQVRVAAKNEVGTGPYTVVGPPLNSRPIANAGPDQTVDPGDDVTLDGSGSRDPDGDSLGSGQYTWTQTGGTPVTLNNNGDFDPSFTAPDSDDLLVFSLVVNDGAVDSAPDTVTITVGTPTASGGGQQPPVTGGGGGGRRGGGGGGGGGGGSRDLHGNTPAQATTLTFSPASPRRATANGQISPAGDVDYFTIEIPRAGLLIVETTGPTDTAGTVWQHDEELASARQGGERRNFRLSTPVEAGPVLIAVRGNGNRTGAYTLVVRLVVGFFGNPRPDSAQSGVGVISGWVCEADTVEIQFENGTTGATHLEPAATGTPRADTESICGDADNGFGLLWNWNLLGDGTHTVRALVDGEVFAEHTLTVTTLGLGEFPEGLSGTTVVADFPDAGATTTLEWQQTLQNFVIVPNEQTEGERADAGAQHIPETARLENPQPGSYQSGIGVISGWKCDCEAGVIAVQFEHGTTGTIHTVTAGYGTSRPDTDAQCGDTDNGFGLLWNWNLLGDGEHIVRAFADGEEFAWSRVIVTTLGEEFAQGLEGTATVADFPVEGQAVTVEWQEALQNFTITGRQ